MTDSKDELRARFDTARNQGNESSPDDSGDVSDVDDSGNVDYPDDEYDWGDKYNYPLYVPREFANELDQLYNQYDGKNKVEGGDGLEKHREFLFPIIKAAVEDLDLDKVVDWEVEDEP